MSGIPEPSVTGRNMSYYSDKAYIDELSDIPELSVTNHNLIYEADNIEEMSDNLESSVTGHNHNMIDYSDEAGS